MLQSSTPQPFSLITLLHCGESGILWECLRAVSSSLASLFLLPELTVSWSCICTEWLLTILLPSISLNLPLNLCKSFCELLAKGLCDVQVYCSLHEELFPFVCFEPGFSAALLGHWFIRRNSDWLVLFTLFLPVLESGLCRRGHALIDSERSLILLYQHLILKFRLFDHKYKAQCFSVPCPNCYVAAGIDMKFHLKKGYGMLHSDYFE